MSKHAADKTMTGRLLWPGLSLVLLLGLLVYQRELTVHAESQSDYHAEVAQALVDLPMSYGSWIGEAGEVPKAAAELLHANEIISRTFRHIDTGEQVDLVVVHCTDARDLLGHYPPVCYPAHGWLQRAAEDLALESGSAGGGEREAGGRASWPCTLYRFERMDQGYSHEMTVLNYMLLPDGRVGPTMEVVDRAAGDLGLRVRGAMQVQVVFRGQEARGGGAETRREVAEEFLDYLWPVFEAVWDMDVQGIEG